MIAHSRESFPGSAGRIEALIDAPPAIPYRGVAIVAHPHPLQGGTSEHKIPQALAKVFVQHGWIAVRPNFRGAGASEGGHDKGRGETDDMLIVVSGLRERYPGLPIGLAGFSFGAYVQACVARTMCDEGRIPAFTVLAGVPFGLVDSQRNYETPGVPEDALVLHGEMDPVAPLAAVLEWARPQHLPVTVIPGANHFFTGYLNTFIKLVERHMASLK